MKLIDVINNENRDEFVKHNYNLPRYDIKKVRENTKKEPTWIHFGAGNIFRAFPAAVLNEILNWFRTAENKKNSQNIII